MRHRQRPHQSRRPSSALRTAAAVAVAVPVLALAPAAAQASPAGTSAEAGQPDLVVSELPTAPPRPGETSHASVTVTNRGTAPAEDIVFRVRLTRGLDFPESVPGCRYTTTGDQIRQSLCHLGITVEPGASATVPVTFEALPKALMETVEYGTGATGEEPGEGFTDSYRSTSLTADSSADLAAVGDRAKGRPGQTVTVHAALRNDGPGWVQNNVSDDQPAVMVNIPEGTVAVRVPSDCSPFEIDGPSGPSQPGKPQYVCYPPDHTLEVGSVHSYTFKLKILWSAESTSGEVKATSVYDIHPEFDHNAANDKAAISVVVRRHHADAASAAASGSGAASAHDSAARSDADGAGPGAHAPQTQNGKQSSVDLASDASRTGHESGTGRGMLPLAAGGAAAATGLGGAAVMAVRRRRAYSV